MSTRSKTFGAHFELCLHQLSQQLMFIRGHLTAQELKMRFSVSAKIYIQIYAGQQRQRQQQQQQLQQQQHDI